MKKEIIKLNNGSTLLYTKKESYFSYMSFSINAGSLDENKKQFGCAHILEHMLFNGTNNHKKGEIEKIIESCGGNNNAYTDDRKTVYHGSIMKEDTKLLIDLFLEMLFSPKLDKNDFEDEKNIVIQELNDSLDDPWIKASDYYDYKNFGQIPIIGLEDSIINMGYKDFIHFYNTFYNFENLTISVATPIDVDVIVEMLNNGMLPYNMHGNKNENRHMIGDVTYEVEEISNGDEQSKMLIGFLPDSKNIDMMSLYSQILGGGMTSRLFKNIREDKKLCYQIFSYSDKIFDKNRITIGISFGELDAAEEICYNCVQEINNMINIEQEEFDRAKKMIISDLCKQEETMNGSMKALLYRYDNNLSLSTDERISDINNITIGSFRKFVSESCSGNKFYKYHMFSNK